ncbi:MAG: glycerate kinase, partial [Acidobacteria bacterium]|nr:glycerate kinase [Acidobacteriota bacterium]
CDDWNFQKAAEYLLGRVEELRKENPGKPVAILSGGELSCPVTGDGMGGRNQAFVLDCVGKIVAQPIIVLSGGTDGIDGNSPAAGAIADGQSLERARVLGLDPEDYQRRSDSFHFFEKLGDAIVTGPTGTNVRDLRLLLAYPDAHP